MTAPAFMPLYIGDYLRDTMHLTRDQHGAYLLLLCACWTHDGRLPNDDKLLASIAKATSDEWFLLRPTMAKFFKHRGKFWTHKRIDTELGKSTDLRQAREKAGKKGAAKRWQSHKQNDGKPMARARVTTATATAKKAPPLVHPPPPSANGAALDDRRRPTRLPVDWQPDAADCQFAGELGLDAGEVASEFRDYWSAIPGRKATRLDWHATFRNACRLYAGRHRRSNGVAGAGKHRQAGTSFTTAIRRAFADTRDEGVE